MAYITPGIRFLSIGAGYLSVAILVCIAIQRLFHIPTWVIATTCIVALPLRIYVPVIWKQFKDERDAASLGARTVPKLNGRLFGNIDTLRTLQRVWKDDYPGDYLNVAFDIHGPVFNLYIVHTDLFWTASPEHLKLMLATDFQNYVKGERFQETMSAVLGTGVFNSDGEMWKFHRSITRPAFTRDRISDYELFDRHAMVVISQLKKRLLEGYAVDFQDLMSRFTLDAATEFLFGTCAHSLSAGLPYPHNVVPPHTNASSSNSPSFSAAFCDALEAVGYRNRYGSIWPLFEMFEDRARKPMQIVDGFIDPIVKAALMKKKAKASDEKKRHEAREHLEEGETLLDHLVNITEDSKVIKDETLNIMIAGRDTTAGTLTFLIYLLAMHPHVMARLRQEILEQVGPTKMPEQDKIKDMKYLRAVINETLRLFPVVPFNVRESVKAALWPHPDPNQRPYYIPAGTKIAYSVFVMQRRKDLWGPDADEFDPNRFLDDRLRKYLTKNPFIFLPFNGGPRICLGQQFAYNEMSFMIVRLLQSFSSITLDPTSAPPGSLPPPEWKSRSGRTSIERVVPKRHLTMYCDGGLWVKMQEASDGTV
ncbi:cytochrome P450 monooxygenase pc-1 [Amanita muscaria]